MSEAQETTICATKVKPFQQPNTNKGTVLTAITYKPSLKLTVELYSTYPAVDKNGVISEGLLDDKTNCAIPDEQSQVYSRGDWHKGRWGQMYAWHVRTRPTWLNVVYFFDNPSVKNPTLLAVSIFIDNGYITKAVPTYAITESNNERTIKIRYADHQLYGFAGSTGSSPPLITWELMTEKAREALNNPLNFNKVQAPFNNAKFHENIKKAWESTNL